MKRKILIVEDNQINRSVLSKILSDEYDVLEAANGVEALDIMHKNYKALSAVLLDIVMPIMDGYELLEKIHGNVALSQIPIIVVTVVSDEKAEVKALSLGANDFITKPYNPSIVKHRIRNTINLRETASIVNAIQRDKLTGLYNREAFFEKSDQMIKRNVPGTLIMACFDIDNFKIINDQLGAFEGDKILKHIGVCARESINRIEGICSRISGDNFAILYPNKNSVIEYVDEMINKAFISGDIPANMSLSVGRCIVNDISLPASAIYDRAYIAKQSIKGRYDVKTAYFDESMLEKLVLDQDIINSMDNALLDRQFEVWFQPQFNLQTEAIMGAEALVRWRHPIKGLIAPNDFIPVFEQNGFIFELDKFVWEETCRMIRKWIDDGRSPVPISVNVSRYDLFKPQIKKTLEALLDKYNLSTDLLRLEVTESAFASSPERMVEIVKGLVDAGFTIEIDDFGSGYSSLNTLKDVAADVIKLDMKFLEDGHDTQRGGNIIESVVRMAKWLGMAVIAEGVETTEQATFLRTIGCNYAQGYLYAKPMPEDRYILFAREIAKAEKLLTLQTVENLDNNAFWDPKSMDSLIFSSYIGGACIFEYSPGKVEVLRANKKYGQVIGNAGMTIADALKMDWLKYLNDEDKMAVKRDMDESIRTGDEVVRELCMHNLPGSRARIYLRMTLRVIAVAGEHYLVYCTAENITDQRLAEEELRRTNETMRRSLRLVDDSSSSVYVCDAETFEVYYANKKCAEMCGRAVEEAMGMKCYKFLKNYDKPCDPCHMEDCNEDIYTEAQYTSDATGRHYLMRGKFIEWDGRKALVEYLMDETERVKAQQENRAAYEHEVRLRQEILNDAISSYQINLSTGAIEDYHTLFNDTIEVDNNTIIDDKMREILLQNVLEEDKEKVESTILAKGLREAYERGETSVNVVYRRKIQNLGHHWVKAVATMVKRPDSDDIIAFLYNKDVDQEVNKQLAIDGIIDDEIEAVTIVNVKSGYGRMVKVKHSYNDFLTDEFFEYDKNTERIISSSIFEADRQNCKDSFMLENLTKTLSKSQTMIINYRTIGLDGKIKRKRARAYYIDETHENIVIARRDITDIYEEEQRQKQELQCAVDAANRANNAKTEFLSRMSHDMRTPLNAVIGMVSLAKEEDEIRNIKDYLDNIDISGRFLLGLINDILDLSKIEKDKIELKKEPFPLDEFIRGVNTVIAPMMKAKEIEFEFNMGCGAENILVDKLRFNQIFFNLLSNAAKFTPPGGKVIFSAEHLPNDKIGRHGMRFHVIDSGCGMSEEFQKRLFDPFQQEENKENSEQQGSGLGLAIVKNLVELMGGMISVKSAPGEGSEFIVDLYAYMLTATEDALNKKIGNDYNLLKGAKILLVEDNKINAVVATKLLEKEGCIVETCENGVEGFERFKKSDDGFFNVVLMDIRMPIMGGLEATKRIRELPREDSKTIPIIAMTADAFTEDRERTFQAGMNAYISKPVEKDVLYDVVSQEIRKNMKNK